MVSAKFRQTQMYNVTLFVMEPQKERCSGACHLGKLAALLTKSERSEEKMKNSTNSHDSAADPGRVGGGVALDRLIGSTASTQAVEPCSSNLQRSSFPRSREGVGIAVHLGPARHESDHSLLIPRKLPTCNHTVNLFSVSIGASSAVHSLEPTRCPLVSLNEQCLLTA